MLPSSRPVGARQPDHDFLGPKTRKMRGRRSSTCGTVSIGCPTSAGSRRRALLRYSPDIVVSGAITLALASAALVAGTA